jgi:hypothetical protein
MGTQIVLVLGRDGFGETPSEQEFDSWVVFVATHIDERTGLDISVEERGAREPQSDSVLGCDADEREIVSAAKQDLWQQWCAAGGAS